MSMLNDEYSIETGGQRLSLSDGAGKPDKYVIIKFGTNQCGHQ